MMFRQLRLSGLLCALLLAAFAFSAPAQAQDQTYVDLSIEIRAAAAFSFTARNQGTATAYGVAMDIEIGDQTIHSTSAGFEQKSGTTCSGHIPGTTCVSGTFTLGTLKPGEEISRTVSPRLAAGVPTTRVVPGRAVVYSTFPEEEERFKGNNTAVGWRVSNGPAVGRYWLEASVDDLLPDAGDTIKFNFRVRHLTATDLDDAKVRLKLDNGMGTPTATPPSGTTFAAATGLARTWDWNVGSIGNVLEVSTTLDNPLPTGVVRSDLCLTAELTARPDNSGVVGRATYTSAEICLREDPVVLLQEGQARLFAMYPCVGVTAYPCSSGDTIEMWAIGDAAARAAGIARDEAVLDPKRVFVQVKDPEGRRIDTHSGSVNSGTAPSWHTYRPAHANMGGSAVGGVGVVYTLQGFAGGQRDNYTALERTLAVAGFDGAAAPGAVNIRWPSASTDAEFAANPSGTASFTWFPTGDSDLVSLQERFVEFETLGTYKLDYTPEATHNNGTPSDTMDDVEYSGTSSYIFHVGPIAELEVSDGAAGLASAGTRAFTIVAVNNGPDDAPAVQVTVTDLSGYESHTATAGTFDSSTGVWTIGEVRERGYYQDIYGRDGEILTIITTADVDAEITAEIENTQDYEVCIDSSGDDVALSSPSETACTNEDHQHLAHSQVLRLHQRQRLGHHQGQGRHRGRPAHPAKPPGQGRRHRRQLGPGQRGQRAAGDPLRGAEGDQPLGNGGGRRLGNHLRRHGRRGGGHSPVPGAGGQRLGPQGPLVGAHGGHGGGGGDEGGDEGCYGDRHQDGVRVGGSSRWPPGDAPGGN